MRFPEPLDLDAMLSRIERAVRPYPKAALFELRDRGHGSVFEQVVACVVSVRTRDETTLEVAERVFSRGRTPADFGRLEEPELDALLRPATFHAPKAKNLLAIARVARERFGGELPCDREALLALPGVGPKCANLALGVACGEPLISVDVHVHRVTNRWGYVSTRTPEATLRELERLVPARHRVTLNRLLVPFGKHVCTGALPRCSTCPVRAPCRRVGVTSHR